MAKFDGHPENESPSSAGIILGVVQDSPNRCRIATVTNFSSSLIGRRFRRAVESLRVSNSRLSGSFALPQTKHSNKNRLRRWLIEGDSRLRNPKFVDRTGFRRKNGSRLCFPFPRIAPRIGLGRPIVNLASRVIYEMRTLFEACCVAHYRTSAG